MIARMDGPLPLPDGYYTNIWVYGYEGSGITLATGSYVLSSDHGSHQKLFIHK